MQETLKASFTAFHDQQRLVTGPLGEVALAVKASIATHPIATFLVFDDQTGRVVDLDIRGSDADVLARLQPDEQPKAPAGRGRPALGVVPREVTLLPQQWDWLMRSSRNVSATLRRLVDEARRRDKAEPSRRQRQESAYRFMTAIAGDLPRYEDATRALFADDAAAFARQVANWPRDIREHAERLAFADVARSVTAPVLIILGGLPGTGKTTIARALARQIGAVHLRVDTIEQTLGGVAGSEAGYAVAQRVAKENLRNGQSVIADSVNPVAASRAGWRGSATEAGVVFLEIEVICSDRAQHRQRAETRPSDISGHVHPRWEEIETLAYESWPEAMTLDTSTMAARDAAEVIARKINPAQAPIYLEPTQDSGRDFVRRGIKGPVMMLNLLRFRPVADYSAHPHLAPSEPISGAAAFERYVALTLPHLEAGGGALTFFGEGGPFLVGPADERWDCVMLVRQASVESFLAFAKNTEYLAGLAHRIAAVADARLIPVQERSVQG